MTCQYCGCPRLGAGGGCSAGGAGGTSYQMNFTIETERQRQRPFVMLGATIHLKGGKWLAVFGDVEAWGDTPDQASRYFDNIWTEGITS